ncbi:hypothetical protein [Lentzea terrae]|uniref:hypothetical protein n=1 Tax=Lentzea terrae TaxID=2200761 RepID=UPI0013009E2E|nr:hypothetical protein [Lentzea terrae]
MSQPKPTSSAVETPEVQTPDPRRWGTLAVVVSAQLLIVLDSSVVTIALPSAQAELGMSDSAKQWVVAAYTLTWAFSSSVVALRTCTAERRSSCSACSASR